MANPLARLLDELEDSQLQKALDEIGIKNKYDIRTIPSNKISTLCYKEELLPLGSRIQLQYLKAWLWHLKDTYRLEEVDWDNSNTVNADSYDKYRTSAYDPDRIT